MERGEQVHENGPFLIWVWVTLLGGACMAGAGLLMVGFGKGEEMVRTFWGPALSWLLLGGVAYWRAKRGDGPRREVKVGVAVLGGMLVLMMPYRIWQREYSVVAREMKALEADDDLAVGQFLARHEGESTPELEELRRSWERSEEASWALVANGHCDQVEEYRRRFPRGKHSKELPAKEEACAWRETQFFAKGDDRHEIANLQRYLRTAPLGLHRAEAEGRIDRAFWSYVLRRRETQGGLAEAAKEYLAEVPWGEHRQEAERIVWGTKR